MRARLTGLTIAALVPSALAAQTNAGDGSDAMSNEIVVIATGQSTASASTKTDTPLIENPQTITVVNRAEMDIRAVDTVSDALSYVAGVQAQPQGNDNRVDEITVRGFGAGGFGSNNNFVDGLRLPAGGQWTRPAFDPFGLQQVDVLKGPSSVLYGQTAPGGIVNLVTKKPTFRAHGEVLFQGQAFGDLDRARLLAGADVGAPLSDNVAVRFVGLASHGETRAKDMPNSRYYIAPSVTFRLGADTTWTLLGQYQRDEGASTFQFLPMRGTLNASNGKYIPLDANLGEPGWNDFDRDQYLVASFFEHRFGDGFAIRNNTRYTKIDSFYRAVVMGGDTLTACPANIPGCIPGQTIQRRAVQGRGESEGWATDTQIEARFATGAIEHVVLGGVDYFHTDWSHDRDGVAPALVLPLLDIFDPVPRGASGYAAALSPQIYGGAVSKQTGLYLQDQLSVGNLRLSIGARNDWATDNLSNSLNNTGFRLKAEAFTWNIGGVYLFDFGLAPYASYSESFLPLQNDPVTNATGQPFVPTTGQQYEFGLRYQPPGQNIYLTLSAFQITQQNLLTADPAGTRCGPTLTPCQVQLGEGRYRGLEFEGRATPTDALTLIATATRIKAKVTEGAAAQIGNALPQIPDWQASLFADYRIKAGPLDGFGFGGGVRYTGDSWGLVSNDPLFAIPSYTLFDAFLRYDVPDSGLSLAVNVRNLADKRYVATCTATQACYYGQGRTATARLQYRW
jgi:iron complex outermembrane receptor protein